MKEDSGINFLTQVIITANILVYLLLFLCVCVCVCVCVFCHLCIVLYSVLNNTESVFSSLNYLPKSNFTL